MNLQRALLYARTLPTLRPIQVVDRLRRRILPPSVDLRPAPFLRHGAECTGSPIPWTPGIPGAPRLVDRTHIRLINREREVVSAADWNAPEVDKLWLYNLHYFDELRAPRNDDRLAWRREWIQRWIGENPPGLGNGWEPYPTSLRIVNWIRHALEVEPLGEDAVASLAIQCRWLRDSLEFHLLGNHLLANAKALIFAGAYFGGAEGNAWLTRGLALLRGELGEQLLGDGGHFERSPMYHAIVLEDLLDLINLASGYGPREGVHFGDEPALWRSEARRMLAWLNSMTHPDGTWPSFNDCAQGIAPTTEQLRAYAARLDFADPPSPGEGVLSLAESGYLRVQRGPLVAFLDAAPIGPRYLCGHAHADTLSFELSVEGRRVFVNRGTSCYGRGAQRQLERSTAFHNTVEVGGVDSSEVWDGFRVARRARAFDLRIDEGDGDTSISASHDGYRRLPGRPIHRRTWHFGPSTLGIEDVVTGLRQPAIARLHLHPGQTPQATNSSQDPPSRLGVGCRVVAREASPEGSPLTLTALRGSGRIVPSEHYPEFSKAIESTTLEVEFDGERARVDWNF